MTSPPLEFRQASPSSKPRTGASIQEHAYLETAAQHHLAMSPRKVDTEYDYPYFFEPQLVMPKSFIQSAMYIELLEMCLDFHLVA
jgi:hypothetical protein